MQIQSLPFSLWNPPRWLRTESRGLACNFLVKRDFVSCWMNLQHPEQCLACTSLSFICCMNIEGSNLGSSWWGSSLLLEPRLPSHWSALGLWPWERLLLLTPFPGVSGLGVGSAWTGRVGVFVCLPNIWVQAGRVLPAVNHHFGDHACAYDQRANQQALQQPP